MNKKNVALLLMIVALMLCLTACNTPPEPSLDVPDVSNSGEESLPPVASADPIDNFEAGSAEMHEPILPLEFEDGETVDNPYYKKTTNEEGMPCYMVINASTNQPVYMPMAETVIYSGENEDCFYERYTFTFEQNGEYRSTTQYQLHVNSNAVVDGGNVPTDVDVQTGAVQSEPVAGPVG